MKTLEEYLALPYKMEIVPDVADGGFVISYPELKGCITCAETQEEIFAIAQDAKQEWLSAALETGYDIPLPAKQ